MHELSERSPVLCGPSSVGVGKHLSSGPQCKETVHGKFGLIWAHATLEHQHAFSSVSAFVMVIRPRTSKMLQSHPGQG